MPSSDLMPTPPHTPADWPPMPVVPTGLYRHYKGQHYRVLGSARHSEDTSAMVVYQALYGEQGWWVRPAAMFAQTVTVAGQEVARFTRVGD